jgi:peptidoglycan/xylan/chitin deacetylase (PgdA/CDA1 family)
MSWTRNFVGYGGNLPHAGWPGGARVALSLVLNVEEGAELAIADGDERNEATYEIVEEVKGGIDPAMMSHFEYGTRAGYWRIMAVLGAYGAACTLSTCGRVAERAPQLLRDAVARGHEVACHGYRWERHAGMDEAREADVIARTHAAIAAATGVAPAGWHTRSASTEMTRRLLVRHGGFLYDSDAYNDDLPYVVEVEGAPHVVLPYSFDTNDMRFSNNGGFVHADDFARYCADAYDWLWREGGDRPRMMSVGLHLRIVGRPGRIAGLERFLAHVAAKGGAWIARRDEIARHWRSVAGLADWRPGGG